MKAIISFVGFIVLVGAILFIRGTGTKTELASTNETLGTKTTAEVLAVSPEVLLKKSGGTFERIDRQERAIEGDEIKTTETGRASLAYANNTVSTLGKNAHITIKNLANSGNVSRLELLTGGLWSKIERVSGKGEFYEVQTENMVAAVRGTVFATLVKDGISSLFVLESKVQAKARNPLTKEIIPGTDIAVTAGSKIIINNANLPSKEHPIEILPISWEDLELDIIKQNITEKLRNSDALKDIRKPDSTTGTPVRPTPPSENSTTQPSEGGNTEPIITPQPTPAPTPIIEEPPLTASPEPQQPEPVLEALRIAQAQSPKNAEGQIINIREYGITEALAILVDGFSVPFHKEQQDIVLDDLSQFEPGTYRVIIINETRKQITLKDNLVILEWNDSPRENPNF
ncbi:MAG: hypothetical protein COU08_00505 [Candidatus Harrisonbacteria bacterium CG10_big_fil_rev_8_21_14_0_10_42_17]|uniref:FecR protein domain-containing protein n=1 Tax=Candidatus Harrisonbacteria bacterium CG10_big_fil_rev_8_21_14_0_10_42_17 TaxID=1974584 RepID=A0A2M6WJ48_9BACT|nr:MAG: hypothetical protein COU08_00505 [Candidatus Harrisonbacteria bacterium CG10_big_fil_rev_8_21_14_0_10_42_17]